MQAHWAGSVGLAGGKIMGKTLLLIHGIGCTGAVWDPMLAGFRAAGHTPEPMTLYPERRLAENPPASLPDLGLNDYVLEARAQAARLTARDGQKPVVIGHSMGGLIAQKLCESDDVSAGVFLSPAQPADCAAPSFSVVFTFANIVFAPRKTARDRAFKVWRTGFYWGVLNRVEASKRAGIYAGAVYDSGQVYGDIGEPESDPHRAAFVDETKINVPTLTIAGGADRACTPKNVRKMKAKYARSPVPGDFREFPDLAHWVFAEPGRDKVGDHINEWIAARTGGAPAN